VLLNTETYDLLDIFVRQILVEPELKIEDCKLKIE
jgi:hypothetical protein